MESRVESYSAFLKKSENLVIPCYQRNYQWEESLCRTLIDDLLILSEKEDLKHFFGTVIFVADSFHKSIVDGQQRAITVSLCLIAIRDLINEGILQTENQENLLSYIRSLTINSSGTPIIVPIKKDRKSYDSLVHGKIPPGSDNVVTNYNYLKRYITRVSHRNDSTVRDVATLAYSVDRLEIVSIGLKPLEDHPQDVFDSINSKMQLLSDTDRIRNFLFMGRSSSEQERLYGEYWLQIEKNVSSMENFLTDFLTVERKSIPSKQSLSRVFRKNYSDVVLRGDEEYYQLFDRLLKYSEIYNKLENPESWTNPGSKEDRRIGRTLIHLNYLRSTFTYPFFMRILKESEDDSELWTKKMLADIFETIENYVVRLRILRLDEKGKQGDSLNRVFATLYSNIAKLDADVPFVERLKYVVLRKKDRIRYPDDSTVQEILRTAKIYDPSSKTLGVVILSAIENQNLTSDDIVQRVINRDLTVEHIIPQTMSQQWRDYLGGTASEIEGVWENRLGNLTLTLASYNSQLGNRTYHEKRTGKEYGYIHSGFRIDQMMHDNEEWDLDLLIQRNEQMVSDFLKNVPHIFTSYVPRDQSVFEELTIDEEFDGKRVKAYYCEGKKVECKDTLDAYLRILRDLYADHPRSLRSIDIASETKEPLFCDKRNYSKMHRKSRYKPLDEGKTLYVCTDYVDTRKIKLIRDIYEELGLEPDFIFEVDCSSNSCETPA